MSYAYSWALQRALAAALRAHPVIVAEAGGVVVDAAPKAAEAPGAFVLIGEETVRPWGDADGAGAEHRVVIAAVADDPSFARLKRLAAAVAVAALAPPPLETGRLALAAFVDGATRTAPELGRRRIDQRFRFLIEPTPAAAP